MRRCSARSARLRQASAAPSRRALSTGSARRASSRQVTACLRYAAGVSTMVLPLPSQKLGRPIIKIRLNCRALTSTCQAAIEPADQYAGMPSMPTGIDPASLPNIDHCRSHGIDRITVWCLTPFCCHQGMVTFEAFAAHGAGETTKLLSVKPRLKCTKCGGRHADLQANWLQRSTDTVVSYCTDKRPREDRSDLLVERRAKVKPARPQ
jgi:hypothetical protein